MSENKSPWGSGSGGGNDGGPGKGKSPWGQGGNGSNNPRPGATNSEKVIEDFKKRFGAGGPRRGGGGSRRPGGGKGSGFLARFGPFGVFLIVAGLYFISTCVYMVDQNEEAVVLRFGKYSRTTNPGVHFKLPNPVETKEIIPFDNERSVEIGVSKDNLMLTGDENIARIAYTILWRVKNSSDFKFTLENPENAVADVAESAMREVVGKTELEPLITDQRDAVAVQVQELMQQMLDEYQSGIQISQVEIKESQEPRSVEKAFLDVVAAKQEAEKSILKARERENELIPQANAEADKLIQQANAYKEAVIAESTGDASRFTAIYKEYKLAPRVTRDRMYLETLEDVYGEADKIILDDAGGSGVVPYLPLDQLRPKKQ